MTKKLKKVVIDRKKWGRGRFLEGEDSMLFNPDTNQMCCLGFLAKACGVPLNKLAYNETPAQISRAALPAKMSWLVSKGGDSDLADMAMILNDTRLRRSFPMGEDDSPQEAVGGTLRSEKDRERRIAKLFAEHGFEAVFIN